MMNLNLQLYECAKNLHIRGAYEALHAVVELLQDSPLSGPIMSADDDQPRVGGGLIMTAGCVYIQANGQEKQVTVHIYHPRARVTDAILGWVSEHFGCREFNAHH